MVFLRRSFSSWGCAVLVPLEGGGGEGGMGGAVLIGFAFRVIWYFLLPFLTLIRSFSTFFVAYIIFFNGGLLKQVSNPNAYRGVLGQWKPIASLMSEEVQSIATRERQESNDQQKKLIYNHVQKALSKNKE